MLMKLPYISPTSPLYLPYISLYLPYRRVELLQPKPISPLHLPSISLYLPCRRVELLQPLPLPLPLTLTLTLTLTLSRRVELLQPKPSPLRHRLHTDDELFISFIGTLLRLHPDDRPTAEQALQHPFITQGDAAAGQLSDTPSVAPPAK